MSEGKIKIIIEGEQGSGKTKIANIIANALHLCGIRAIIKDEEPDLAPYSVVEIETRQTK